MCDIISFHKRFDGNSKVPKDFSRECHFKWYFDIDRWDPKKRMTPDEAIRHEWLKSSSSHMSSSWAIASSTNSSANTTTNVESSQSAHPRTRNVTTNAPWQQRRKSILHDISVVQGSYKYVQKISTGENADNGGLVVKSKLNGSASSHALASSAQTTTSRHASTGDIVASLDLNLDDSGTFLPPILWSRVCASHF